MKETKIGLLLSPKEYADLLDDIECVFINRKNGDDMTAEMRNPVAPQTITIKASGCVPEMSVRGTVTQVRVDTETRLGCIQNSCLKPVPIRPIIVKTLTIQFTDGIIMAPDSEMRAGKQKKKKSSTPLLPPKRKR